MDLTKEVLYDLATKGISEDDLRKGKEQLKGSLILSLEGTGSRMNRLGKNELMLGRHYTLDEMISNIEKISMDDVESVLDLMFSEPFAVAMVGTSDRSISELRGDDFVTLRSNK
ncbi:hypothetical protein D3C76_1287250 [compost metagenome]